MKKSLLAATAGIIAGAALLVFAAPASAHERVGFAVAIGAPVPYIAPAPVVYGAYGPVVTIGSPYYYNNWGYYHGYRGDHGGWRSGERGGFHGGRR